MILKLFILSKNLKGKTENLTFVIYFYKLIDCEGRELRDRKENCFKGIAEKSRKD